MEWPTRPRLVRFGDGAVVRVDVGDYIARDEFSKSPVVTELEYIEPLCMVFESGSTTIISLRALGKGALDRLRHVDLLGPLLGADGVAVQGVDNRIAALLLGLVARGQEDDDVAIDGIAFEIAFEASCRES